MSKTLLLADETFPAGEDPWLMETLEKRSSGTVSRSGVVVLHSPGREMPVRGRFGELVAGRYVLSVGSPGRARSSSSCSLRSQSLDGLDTPMGQRSRLTWSPKMSCCMFQSPTTWVISGCTIGV